MARSTHYTIHNSRNLIKMKFKWKITISLLLFSFYFVAELKTSLLYFYGCIWITVIEWNEIFFFLLWCAVMCEQYIHLCTTFISTWKSINFILSLPVFKLNKKNPNNTQIQTFFLSFRFNTTITINESCSTL